MNKKNFKLLLTIVVATAIIVWIGYKPEVSENDTTTNTATTKSVIQKSSYQTESGIYLIKYTDSGFIPGTLSVPKGKTVKFINYSSGKLKVYSDTNMDINAVRLSQLSADEVGFGTTYTISFDKTGTWSYHNQFKTADKGSVVVK